VFVVAPEMPEKSELRMETGELSFLRPPNFRKLSVRITGTNPSYIGEDGPTTTGLPSSLGTSPVSKEKGSHTDGD
jgi:hypothetical protein